MIGVMMGAMRLGVGMDMQVSMGGGEVSEQA